MESTIIGLYRGIFYWGYIGRMEKNMETTIIGYIGLGVSFCGVGFLVDLFIGFMGVIGL